MMTFSQVEKARSFIRRLDTIHGFEEMDSFIGELRAYYDLFFNIKLEAYVHNIAESYTEQMEEKDKASIKCFLDSRLDENDICKTVFDILDLIDEGKESLANEKNMGDFVSKAYYSYNGVIKFDKTTEAVVAASADAFNLGTIQADSNMVNGIITKLRDYGRSLLSKPSSKQNNSPSVVINNTNSATANANATVDFSVSIKQARQQIEDLGLGDQQYREILKKLSEIETIGNSNDSKGQKWKKAKELLKWCAEQGIEIAKVVLPILAQMLGR